MNTLLRIFLALAIGCSAVQAQEKPAAQNQNWSQQKQQFKADKVAYITTNMNFTVEEAQKFWPVYNKYDEIFDNIADERYHNYDPKRCHNICELSPEVCTRMMENSFVLDQKELDARQKFYQELVKIFPPNKIMLYYHTEFQYRRKVMQESRLQGNSFGKSFKND